ncbi:hypothetical protein, conserved in T.vivax [Trypanosoma vivax Y486]|uniref:Transmembrane protein n=1 Tax=Trypanosoma vivax (strain Y486) TaxID=1055687 RepID=F9WUC2_TRYVY|nr:hypothetical protein, conserved in T.vivax [Trypanosoma vivax Y486]|eukprot:CCD21170.1 hypothetical protein, conserved in T.vivax [Trypanosoma vivax Y486]
MRNRSPAVLCVCARHVVSSNPKTLRHPRVKKFECCAPWPFSALRRAIWPKRKNVSSHIKGEQQATKIKGKQKRTKQKKRKRKKSARKRKREKGKPTRRGGEQKAMQGNAGKNKAKEGRDVRFRKNTLLQQKRLAILLSNKLLRPFSFFFVLLFFALPASGVVRQIRFSLVSTFLDALPRVRASLFPAQKNTQRQNEHKGPYAFYFPLRLCRRCVSESCLFSPSFFLCFLSRVWSASSPASFFETIGGATRPKQQSDRTN